MDTEPDVKYTVLHDEIIFNGKKYHRGDSIFLKMRDAYGMIVIKAIDKFVSEPEVKPKRGKRNDS
jgi:hypothetical protein